MAHFHYQVGDEIKAVQIERHGEAFEVTVGEQSYRVVARPLASGRLTMRIGDQTITAIVATADRAADQRHYVWLGGDTWALLRATGRRSRHAAAQQDDTGHIVAPMPGQLLAVLVTEGEAVALGDPLVVLGAMKMETRLTAPYAGVVQTLACAVGDTVERGQLLVQLTRA
jgi:acetyl/propionyl-CoA carboxylase alpha subunit